MTVRLVFAAVKHDECLIGHLFVQFIKKMNCPVYFTAVFALPIAVVLFRATVEQFQCISAGRTAGWLLVPKPLEEPERLIARVHSEFFKRYSFNMTFLLGLRLRFVKNI